MRVTGNFVKFSMLIVSNTFCEKIENKNGPYEIQ